MKGDMIVKLYNLEDNYDYPKLKEHNINIIRPLSPDNETVLNFIKTHFAQSWASETAVALNRPFATCFIAVQDKKLSVLQLLKQLVRHSLVQLVWSKISWSWCWYCIISKIITWPKRNGLYLRNYWRRW